MAEQTQKPTPNVAEFSVSELASAIKRALEDGFGYVRLRGEVSGYRGPHASGHCYFALKDDKAKIEAVVWRGVWSKLKIRPEEGLEVIATGKISSFPGSSKYQIVIEALEPAGLGALMAQLEERKRKLTAEGLFDDARKRKIPFLPSVVGIVTSPTGAVIRDMLHGFAERFPTSVLVWPVRVQGEGSAAEVAAAIRGFNALAPGGAIQRPDVLIVARGGGSLEDLWGFNDETVVRAVAASELPIISAVGHETDWTLIDLAADARAPTPTKAAEWAVPKYADLVETSGKLGLRLGVAARRVLDAARRDLRAAARGLPRADDLVALPRQRTDALANRLDTALRSLVQRRHTRFAQISGRLPSPRTFLAAPRQRFNAAESRLGLALLGNTRAHHTRHARIAPRLNPRLLETRIGRLRDRLEAVHSRARDALARTAATRRSRLERASGRLQPTTTVERIGRCRERLAVLDGRMTRAIAGGLKHHRRAVDAQAKLLVSLSYQSVLGRGYALVRDGAGTMIRAAAAVSPGQALEIEFADGRVAAKATAADGSGIATGVATSPLDGAGQESSNGERKPTAGARPQRGPGKSGQGSLF